MQFAQKTSPIGNLSRKHVKELVAVCLLWLASALAASAQTFTLLHNFDGTDGSGPGVTLAQGRDGDLYATAVFGGPNSCGTAYRFGPSKPFEVLYNFTSEACTPTGVVALGRNGVFYATVQDGGVSGDGGVFTLSAENAFSLLASFDDTNGAFPAGAGILLGSDGNYYGSAGSGGTNNEGTIYKVTPSGAITVLHDFGTVPNDGSDPVALIQGPYGAFYGLTPYGGSSGDGVVFRVTSSGGYKILVNFDGPNGATPYPGGLLLATDGSFYGNTSTGGAYGYGTVFSMTPAGVLTVLHSFSGGAGGETPLGTLIETTDGKLYGTTGAGGAFGCGTIFSIARSGSYSVLHDFDGTDGCNAYGGLTQHTNGMLYGSLGFGGAHGDGTLFSFDVGLGPFVKFLLSSGIVGSKAQILGDNLTGTTGVSFNGTAASFSVASDTFLVATVPVGATTGPVVVTTPSGTLTSNVPFRVAQ